MNDINSDSFLKELENDCPFPPLFSSINQPLIDEEEQAVVLGSSFDVEDLLNLVSPLTAAVPPPIAVRSTPAQPCELAATSSSHHSAEAAGRKKKATTAHTLSARKRRAKINGKIRVLRGLVPNCNKSDTASILDDVTERLKSLQLQNEMQQQHIQVMEMKMNNMQMGQAPFMAQASNPIGLMWSRQVAPGLYPYDQVQIPNMDQQFNGVGTMWDPQVAPGLYPYHEVQILNPDQQFHNVQHEQIP